MAILICPEPFHPYAEIVKHDATLPKGSFGATTNFIGTMRDFNEGDDVSRMNLEHYPGMTEKQLELIIERTHEQWPIQDALIVHRVGIINPGDPIVLTAIWAAHRAAAFDACRFMIESLKLEAPFWKKETLTDNSSRWVATNTPGFSG